MTRRRQPHLAWLLLSFVTALLVTHSAHAAGRARSEHVLYVPLPPGISEHDVRTADEPLKSWLSSLPAEHLRRQRGSTGLQPLEGDAVVIFVDRNGEPVLPELAAARRAKANVETHAVPTIANELTFSFESSSYPWSPDDVVRLRNALNAFYPTIKTVYGAPAFAITVNVRRDPTSPFVGLYNPSLNEIVLLSASDLGVLGHELIHAFRDDAIVALSSFEEGMTRAAEIEVFNRLAPAYTHSFDQSHSYTYDVYYEALNRSAIGSRGGAFFAGYISPLLRYQLAGYAWGKGLLENPEFLVTFNKGLYASALLDQTILFTESKLVALAAAAQPTVEGAPFDTWYGKQGVLDTDPPAGYFLYQRINQFTVDYFFRDDATGVETMQPHSPIQWAVYDHRDSLLGSGSAVTSANGLVDLQGEVEGLLSGHSGRFKLVTNATSPGGPVSDTALRSAGAASGVFGALAEGESGAVTITPLDAPGGPVTVGVENGGFTAPSLGSVKGRFAAVFQDSSGRTVARQFTKDASDYFLLMASTGGQADLGVTGTMRKTVKSGATLSYVIAVHNAGPDDASDVVVTAGLPVGSVFVGASATGICSRPGPADGTLTCALGSVPNGGSATATVEITVSAGAKSVLESTASVSASTDDPDATNNSVLVRSKVVGKPQAVPR